MDALDLATVTVSDDVLAAVSPTVAEVYGILPLRLENGGHDLVIATAAPDNLDALADLGFMLSRRIVAVRADRDAILAAIERCGSLNAAAKELKMSYRGLWGKIKTTEESLGMALLEKKAGGASGGGSELTPLARSLVEEFKKMHDHVNFETDLFFDEIFSRAIQNY